MAEKRYTASEEYLPQILDSLLRIEALLRYEPQRQWRIWECSLMNRLDFRFWFCECEYVPPYGLVTFADCDRHG